MKLKDITKESVNISQEASFRDAVELMINEKTNSLSVIDDAGVFVGELSITNLLDSIVPDYLSGDDIAAHFATGDMFDDAIKDTEQRQVKFFMSTKVTPVKETENIMSVATHAVANKSSRIPVVDDNGKPIGIISRRGIKHIIAHALNISEIE